MDFRKAEQDFYNLEFLQGLSDEDEISLEEEAFMQGYLAA